MCADTVKRRIGIVCKAIALAVILIETEEMLLDFALTNGVNIYAVNGRSG